MRESIVVLGATATGKSRLAVELAKRDSGEIINADALQVYRGFDIGTAKPLVEELDDVPHHLIDILEPHERFSAGRFARLARTTIHHVLERDRLPILVGGSGLYLRALLEGMSPLPEVAPEVDHQLRHRLESSGLGELRAELERLDPKTARRLAPGDTQRTLRALAVLHSSGRPLSDWIAAKPAVEDRIEAVKIGLTLARPVLYDRISLRIDRMMSAGWVDEVQALLESGLDPSLPAFQAIGYRQLAEHVQGKCSLEEAEAEILRATKQYARRQLTWFRRETGVNWFPAEDFEPLQTAVMSFLRGSRFKR